MGRFSALYLDIYQKNKSIAEHAGDRCDLNKGQLVLLIGHVKPPLPLPYVRQNNKKVDMGRLGQEPSEVWLRVRKKVVN